MKSQSKAMKEIRATLAQMDEALALSELAAKQRAEILSDKAKLLGTLIEYEREVEDRLEESRRLRTELKTAQDEVARLTAELAKKPTAVTSPTAVEALKRYEQEKLQREGRA